MTTKTTGSTRSAPATPSCSSCRPKADAVAPATIPRGAIQATSPRSGQVSGDPRVARRTTSGRSTRAKHEHEHDRLRAAAPDVARRHRRGDEHEQDADQQLHERLLELAGERD